MKAKEKAKELIESKFYFPTLKWSLKHAIECSLILVNERLEELNFTHIGYGKEVIEGYQKTKLKYWNDVKQEIENYETN